MRSLVPCIWRSLTRPRTDENSGFLAVTYAFQGLLESTGVDWTRSVKDFLHTQSFDDVDEDYSRSSRLVLDCACAELRSVSYSRCASLPRLDLDAYFWRSVLHPELHLTRHPYDCLASLGNCLAPTGVSIVDLVHTPASAAPPMLPCQRDAGCAPEWASFARRYLLGESFLVHTAGDGYGFNMGLSVPHATAPAGPPSQCDDADLHCRLRETMFWQLFGDDTT